ncbi:MAG: GGDEF domain-containing protein [Gammaproteobacteria bacterium]|nr:MAG: GGDEF domain-containing protein [Gammaproteobacteria bacterium]
MNNSTQDHFGYIQSDEDSWILQILMWINYSAVFFLLAIGTKSVYSGHYQHGCILYLFGLVFFANAVYFRKTGNDNKFRFISVGFAALLFLYLTATGGESNTGPLWFYIFPPLIFYLIGLQAGLIVLIPCSALIVLFFRFPELPFVTTEYNADFQFRFLASFCFVTSFSYILDYSRRRTRNELIQLAIKHETASKTDELTGLANRREMINCLQTEQRRFQRYGHHFSVVLIDIDHFKSINDNYGHDAGDQVLKGFGRLLKSHSRQMDMVGRWGGEEFLMMLPETTLVQALALTERLRSDVEKEFFSFNNTRIEVRISAGVCSISQTENLEDLLRLADMNLYEAKNKGRNRIIPMVKSSGLHLLKTKQTRPA